MRRATLNRWAVPALALLVPLGIALPALAQRAGERPSGDLNSAKQMAALMEKGQLTLLDATRLAERDLKGVALSASCEIRKERAEPAPDDHATGDRLIYDVSCFVKDKVQNVQVDGLTKKVLKHPAQPTHP